MRDLELLRTSWNQIPSPENAWPFIYDIKNDMMRKATQADVSAMVAQIAAAEAMHSLALKAIIDYETSRKTVWGQFSVSKET